MKKQKIFRLGHFGGIVLMCFACGKPTAPKEAPAEGSVFFGTYTRKEGHVDGKGRGVYMARRIGPERLGEIVPGDDTAVNPSFIALSADGKYLYAVEETGPGVDTSGHLRAFAVEDGRLRPINRQAVQGFAPCYVKVDPSQRFALTANYAGGVTFFPIAADGSLLPASNVQHPQGSGPTERQTASHPHSVELSPDGRFAYVADLGADKIWIFEVDVNVGRLLPAKTAAVALAPGAGPRHIVLHPDAAFAYVINELNNTVTVLRREIQTGRLDTLESFATLPEDFSGSSNAADIHLTPDGRWLYASNRGHNSIAGFAVGLKDGLLTPIGIFPCRGEVPRGFAISPEGSLLLVGNQNSDNLAAFRIGKKGELIFLWEKRMPTPVCIRFAQGVM